MPPAIGCKSEASVCNSLFPSWQPPGPETPLAQLSDRRRAGDGFEREPLSDTVRQAAAAAGGQFAPRSPKAAGLGPLTSVSASSFSVKCLRFLRIARLATETPSYSQLCRPSGLPCALEVLSSHRVVKSVSQSVILDPSNVMLWEKATNQRRWPAQSPTGSQA